MSNPTTALPAANTPATPTLEFHPDFSTSSPGDIILQSGDNVKFYFDPKLLIEISTFFRDVLSLSQGQPQDGDANLLELPNSTSEGLAFILSLVMVWDGEETPSLPHFQDLPERLDAAMPTIENYELDPIFRMIVAGYDRVTNDEDLPFTRFVIAALANHERAFGSVVDGTLRYRIFQLYGVEKRIFAFLLKWRPDYALRLYQLHDPFHAGLDSLKNEFTDNTFSHLEWEWQCVRANGGDGCLTYQKCTGDYTSMRKLVSANLKRVCEQPRTSSIWADMEKVTDNMIDCWECRGRFESYWRLLCSKSLSEFHQFRRSC